MVNEARSFEVTRIYFREWECVLYPDAPPPHTHSLTTLNPLNAELNPICHLLALLGAHHIILVSGIRVNNEVKLDM